MRALPVSPVTQVTPWALELVTGFQSFVPYSQFFTECCLMSFTPIRHQRERD